MKFVQGIYCGKLPILYQNSEMFLPQTTNNNNSCTQIKNNHNTYCDYHNITQIIIILHEYPNIA